MSHKSGCMAKGRLYMKGSDPRGEENGGEPYLSRKVTGEKQRRTGSRKKKKRGGAARRKRKEETVQKGVLSGGGWQYTCSVVTIWNLTQFVKVLNFIVNPLLDGAHNAHDWHFVRDIVCGCRARFLSFLFFASLVHACISAVNESKTCESIVQLHDKVNFWKGLIYVIYPNIIPEVFCILLNKII